MPFGAVDAEVLASVDAARGQLHSTKIIKHMLEAPPQDALKVVGVIDRDLCIPILTFVFGEAQLGGMASIVSLARLRQEFYGLPADPVLLKQRFQKEFLHELGHSIGLTHCPDPQCVMSLSTSIVGVDKKGHTYCESCTDVVLDELDAGGV